LAESEQAFGEWNYHSHPCRCSCWRHWPATLERLFMLETLASHIGDLGAIGSIGASFWWVVLPFPSLQMLMLETLTSHIGEIAHVGDIGQPYWRHWWHWQNWSKLLVSGITVRSFYQTFPLW
jgi:hypothetical protein